MEIRKIYSEFNTPVYLSKVNFVLCFEKEYI